MCYGERSWPDAGTSIPSFDMKIYSTWWRPLLGYVFVHLSGNRAQNEWVVCICSDVCFPLFCLCTLRSERHMSHIADSDRGD